MTISVSHLSKCFHLYDRPLHRLGEWMTLGQRSFHRPFWALRDVNLDVAQGSSTGIVGPNGAGKSTLLKIVTGTLFPTEGEVRVEGRVAALLELGTGFHPEFTGRLNIYLNGKMLGLTDDEIAERFDEIVRFSELGQFIEQPIRTYSSGMAMRLGFAIASCVDPDVLIIDEALSVGDAHFSQKCVRRIREFREQGVTILFVSHDPAAILTLCDRAVLLEAGCVEAQGTPRDVLDCYNARIAHRRGEENGQVLVPVSTGLGTLRSGNFRALIRSVEVLDASDRPCEAVPSGERVTILVRVAFLDDVENPTVGILIRNRLGIDVFGANTAGLGHALGDFRAGETTDVRFEMPVDLGPDEYSITVAVHRDESHLSGNYDWADKAGRFKAVESTVRFKGIARLNPTVRHSSPRPIEGDVGDTLDSVFGPPPARLGRDVACDAFFIDGWRSVVGEEETGRRRECLGTGRFLFRPAGRRLRIRTGPSRVPGSARPSLRWLGGETVAMAEENPGEIVFELPSDAVGRTRIFSLSLPGADGGESPSMAALEVKSIESENGD
ncbi:ABC transporter ATP-binding protein [Candidatus Sumerlaeota bacterium]|nr:ABC transporter ATP-binding protein [Candidatus Sumerlaeota bacterium]